MRRKFLFADYFFCFVLMGVLILSGCGSSNSSSQNLLEPQIEAAQKEEPTQAPTVEPTELPEPVVEEVVEDECVACHKDKELLIQTAKQVVEVESENEGAG